MIMCNGLDDDDLKIVPYFHCLSCRCIIKAFCTLRKKFSKNDHASSKATTDCKNPKNYHTL